MALNLGLILGSALAGAAAGGGEAAEKMGASMQDAQQKQDLVKMQADLDEQKQLRIQEAEHTFQNQYQQNAFGQQTAMENSRQTFQSGETDKTLASEEKRTAANNATSVQVAGISAASAQTVEGMRAQAMKDVQNLNARGFQIIQDKDGAFVTVDKVTGETTPLLAGGKPIIGAKNVDSASALAAAALLKPDPLDDAATQKAKQDQAYRLLNIDPAKAKGGQQPSAKAIAALKSNPATKAQFDATFGQGAADSVLGTGKDSTAPTTGTPGMPGTPDTGAGTNNPALVNGQLPQTQPTVSGANVRVGANARNPAPTPPVQPAAVAPAPAPYQPSALIANAMTPQTGAPPTQQAFRQQLDAFGRPIPQGGIQNPLGL